MIPKVNGHIHTPYSFSAFNSIEEAVTMAAAENLKILGINDFNTTDGYDEFYESCVKKRIYPLFNIEFMGLIKEYQLKDIRVNDPNNPGRVYLSGKGLYYPFHLRNDLHNKVVRVQEASNEQARQIIDKANAYFILKDIPLKLDFKTIKVKYAKNLVRERHIAKAIRLEIESLKISELEIEKLYRKLYSGEKNHADINDAAGIENEIRNNLLKAGGPAFVPENETAFMSIDEIIEIIVNGGGIPCYPVLLDDNKGNLTDFEKDWDNMHSQLLGLNIGCIELIPSRNSFKMLEKFVRYFRKKNYIIIFGTEHNTPEMTPLTVACRNNILLTDELLKISFEGACVIALHQFMKKSKSPKIDRLEKNTIFTGGYIYETGLPKRDFIKEFAEFGKKIINDKLII